MHTNYIEKPRLVQCFSGRAARVRIREGVVTMLYTGSDYVGFRPLLPTQAQYGEKSSCAYMNISALLLVGCFHHTSVVVAVVVGFFVSVLRCSFTFKSLRCSLH